MDSQPICCIYCGSDRLKENAAYVGLNRIASDCKPWPPGGRFAICQECGYPQTIVTPAWHEDIRSIYKNYSVYFQSHGQEQSVYDADTGEPILRSDHLLRKLMDAVTLPDKGRLLDIGCANGNFLRAFAKAVPGWSLSGVEWDDKYLAQVQAVPGFEKLYTDGLDGIPGTYDVISLLHCFEHIPDPGPMLRSISGLLAPGGLLFIDVPDCSTNPFVLVVADHSSHYSVDSLRELVAREGFEILCATTGWLAKEVSVLARKSGAEPEKLHLDPAYGDQLERHIHWLSVVTRHAQSFADNGGVAIFGTSIAATWLWAELKGNVKFFVDEDPNRIGLQHYGLPIFSPQDAPKNVPIYLALPPVVAKQVKPRLGAVLSNLVAPPDLDEMP